MVREYRAARNKGQVVVANFKALYHHWLGQKPQ